MNKPETIADILEDVRTGGLDCDEAEQMILNHSKFVNSKLEKEGGMSNLFTKPMQHDDETDEQFKERVRHGQLIFKHGFKEDV